MAPEDSGWGAGRTRQGPIITASTAVTLLAVHRNLQVGNNAPILKKQKVRPVLPTATLELNFHSKILRLFLAN